jgi:hypothetical protein
MGIFWATNPRIVRLSDDTSAGEFLHTCSWCSDPRTIALKAKAGVK